MAKRSDNISCRWALLTRRTSIVLTQVFEIDKISLFADKIRQVYIFIAMDDIQNLGDQKYICADEIEQLSVFKRFTLIVNIFISLVPNMIVACALSGYSMLTNVYHLVVPKPLNSIRDQLAVVICDDANTAHRIHI